MDKREGDFTVYNFSVEGFHSYFVSDLGILVHNANYGEGLPINQRLELFFDRIRSAEPVRNAEEALVQIRTIMNQVEDELSGIPRQDPPPPINMPDGRMYPPLDDFTIRNPDGSIFTRSRRHNIEISPQGDITIIERNTGNIVVNRQGGI